MKFMAMFLLLTPLAMGSTCPDPRLRSAEIGGHEIDAALIHNHKGVVGAASELRADNKVLWRGKTDSDGGFKIQALPSGAYTLKVEGWGETSIRLNPRLDRPFNHQVAYWYLLLMDDGCVSTGMNTN